MRIISSYGFIGENLDIKKEVSFKINNKGKISSLSYEDIGESLNLKSNESNYLIVPGFINSHIHIGDSFAKEEGFNKKLIDIVAPPNGLKHRLLRTTSKEIINEGIKKAAIEMLSNGITFFVDFRENGVEGINILRESLQKISIFNLILGRFLDFSEIEAVYEKADGIGLPSYNNLSFKVKDKLQNLKTYNEKIIACHDSEVFRDEILFDEMLKENLVDIIIHGTQYNREDLEKIKEKKKSLILCPRSNGYFGVGFPPISDIIDLEIPISLGTDNIMANNTDLFEEMRYLYRIYRVLSKNERDCMLTSKDLLKTVTINAAKNFRIQKEFGSISEGKYANFFMVDLNEPNFYSYKLDQKNIHSLIVHRTKSENIKKIYIRGVLVFERKCKTLHNFKCGDDN